LIHVFVQKECQRKEKLKKKKKKGKNHPQRFTNIYLTVFLEKVIRVSLLKDCLGFSDWEVRANTL